MEIQELIEKNNLQLRIQEEISAKFIELQKSDDFLGFQKEVIINYLTFENAKPHLEEDYINKVEAGTEKWVQTTSIEKCAEEFLNYMKFAWGKAEGERGISASRSIQKLGMWLWIMNRDDLRIIIEDDKLYNPYGAPALIKVCEQIGIEVPNSLKEFAKVKC